MAKDQCAGVYARARASLHTILILYVRKKITMTTTWGRKKKSEVERERDRERGRETYIKESKNPWIKNNRLNLYTRARVRIYYIHIHMYYVHGFLYSVDVKQWLIPVGNLLVSERVMEIVKSWDTVVWGLR